MKNLNSNDKVSDQNNLQPIIKREMVPYFELLRYATIQDKLLMIIGAIAAFFNGGAMPSISILYGRMADSFSEVDDELVTQAGWNSIYLIVIAVGTSVLSFIMFATWMITGENQSIEFRKRYFSALLHQEIGWFDVINPNELSSRVANETFAVQGAIGEKVPTCIMTFAMTFFGFLIGFVYGWQLALVVTSSLPALSLATFIFSIIVQSSEKATQKAYSDSSALSEQALNAIKTVKTLDGEDFEVQKYSEHLKIATQTTIHYQLGVGLAFGFLWGAMFWAYALAFWYGAKLISDQTYNDNMSKNYTVGHVMTIFFSILTGGFSLGQAGPCLKNFAKGKQAAVQMFDILDRIPKITNPIDGKKLEFYGNIHFKNIYFCYPNRPQQRILNGLNLIIPTGKKIALVGESGCGKSTVMQLLERFYDCEQGEILFGGENGVNVKDIDLIDLRSHIGLVGQEPVLFATSIRENLLYGKTDATDEEMIDALKKANAWDFVSKMDKGLETYVGIGGGQLSGGQKQRIAIARAILKKPQILLLDEATSALDRTNERLIQETLDEISKNITTIVIAHRLSTIQNADLIYVIDKGIVIEQGNHQELMNLHGKYEALAKHQMNHTQSNEQEKQQQQQVSNSQINLKDIIDEEKPLQINLNIFNQNQLLQGAQAEIQKIKQLEVPEVVKQLISNGQNNQQQTIIKDNQTIVNDEEQNKLNVQQKEIKGEVQLSRIFIYSKDHLLCLSIGILASIANGCTFPVFSLFLTEILVILMQSNPDFALGRCFDMYQNPTEEQCNQLRDFYSQQVRQKADDYGLYIFLIGVASIVFWTLQTYFLSYVGEKLTEKLRIETYRKLLRMPISYFDVPKNNAGTLTNKLSVDCKQINGLVSNILGINISTVGCLICGIIIAFVGSWQITLIMLGLMPLAILGGTLQAQFMQGFSDLTDEAYKDSGNLIMEAVTNIRTVVSFGNEKIILNIYAKKVQLPLLKAKKRGIYAGLSFALAQAQEPIIMSIIFYVGAILYRDDYITLTGMFRSLLALMFASMSAGNNAAFSGDVGAAQQASKNIFEVLDSEDEYQKEQRLNKKKLLLPLKGEIHFDNLTYKYPGRDKNVFENLSLLIQEGQKVAFVGSSGCGKSTLMQMLLRFYDPDQGIITVNGIDIQDYDIRHLRRQFGIVSQEPVLFNGSIKENIQYNIPQVTNEQIENAAKKANAYDFIIKNQFEDTQIDAKSNDKQRGQGFDRQVGPKGAQISGGQKQRIAIARTILKESNILLLDEATSALDTTSEQLVQDSLNKLMEGKTTIAIAHRISTIKDSNQIYVFDEGKIVESGNYQELINAKGSFYRLEQGIQK